MAISKERYEEIFAYPNKPEDRERFHRTFAGTVYEDDYLSPGRCVSPLTQKELAERRKQNLKDVFGNDDGKYYLGRKLVSNLVNNLGENNE